MKTAIPKPRHHLSKPVEILRWIRTAELVTMYDLEGEMSYWLDIRDESGLLLSSTCYATEARARAAAEDMAECRPRG